MRRYIGISLVGLFITLFWGVVGVSASCTDAEVNKLRALASNVKLSYERHVDIIYTDVEGVTIPIDDLSLDVHIYNLSENVRVEVTNNKTGDMKKYDYSQAKDGVVTFNSQDITSMVKYTFEFFGTGGTCDAEVLREASLELPAYNDYSSMALCQETPDFYLCQDFVSSSEPIDFDVFLAERDAYIEEMKDDEEDSGDNGFFDKVFDFILDNKFIILGVVIVGGVSAFVIIKKRRSRIV